MIPVVGLTSLHSGGRGNAGTVCAARAAGPHAEPAGAAVGTAGRASVLPRSFYHVFAAEGQDDRASFLLSNMKYLAFRGIFLIIKRLFFKRRGGGQAGRGQAGAPSSGAVPLGGTGSRFCTPRGEDLSRGHRGTVLFLEKVNSQAAPEELCLPGTRSDREAVVAGSRQLPPGEAEAGRTCPRSTGARFGLA